MKSNSSQNETGDTEMDDERSNNGDNSKLKGLPITPVGIRDLVLELFAGKTVERNEIVEAIRRWPHISSGMDHIRILGRWR